MADVEKIEEAIGPINGVNRDFATSEPFVPGSLHVFLSGLLIRQGDDDGFDVISPTLYRMRIAPPAGATLHHRMILA